MDYRLLIVTSRGVYSEPQRTLERVRDALCERGGSRTSGGGTSQRRHDRCRSTD